MKITETNHIFWDNIGRIKNSLAIDLVNFSGLFNLSENQLLSYWKSSRYPPMDKVDSFCCRVCIGIEALFKRDVDLIHINKGFYGDDSSLPCRYDFAKLSRSRTILNCLDYMKVHYGEDVMFSFMRKLQLKPEFLNSLDREINIYLLTDLCKIAKEVGFSNEEIMKMGAWSFRLNKESDLGSSLSLFDDIKEMFKEICDNYSKKFDLNFDYKLVKASNSRLVIRSKISDLCLDKFNGEFVGSEMTDLAKVGVISTFSCYMNKPQSYVLKTHCIYQGDPYTQYMVNLS